MRLWPFAGALLLLAACSGPKADWPAPSPALWQVTAPSGETGHLFGTIHALPDGAEWRTPALDAAADNAGVLIVEISDAGEGGADVFARLARTPGQPPLLSRVPASARADLAEALERSGQEEGDFADLETWAAALMLDSGASGDPANGVDRALIAQARAVRALETRSGQLRLFDRLPEEDQSHLLASAAADAIAAAPEAPLRAWIAGDMAAIERLATQGMLADASLRDTLLTSRNARWLPPIITAIRRGERPLVAVGAVHMAGPDGLPALLAARGFTVARVQ